MKLNPDCIRDILLYIESNSDGFVTFIIDLDVYQQEILLSKYDYDEISYHINQCHLHGFLVSYKQSDDLNGYIFYYKDITPLAHDFLANIRSDNLWNKTKIVASEIGAKSLSAILEISSNLVTDLIKAKFNIC